MNNAEYNCFFLTLLSYISIFSTNMRMYFDTIRPKNISVRGEVRIFTYLIVELYTLIVTWRFIITQNSDYLFKLISLQIYTLINILRKSIIGKKSVFIDCCVFFIRFFYLFNQVDQPRMGKPCDTCDAAMIREDLYQIFKLRLIMILLYKVNYCFILLTLFYTILKNLYWDIFLVILSYSILKILEFFDKSENMKIRIVVILHYILIIIHNFYLTLKVKMSKE